METATGQYAAVAVSISAQVCAISERYEGRGLAKAVAQSAEEQMEAEKKTVQLSPVAYRLSSLTDAAVTGIYRRGKEVMSEADLIRYFDETRKIRTRNCDFASEESIYESANPENIKDEGLSLVAVKDEKSVRLSKLPAMAKEKLAKTIPEWFSFGSSAPKAEKRKFPVSAFAAMVAVAVSLMLIVASSVMVTRAESRISELTLDAEILADEVAELHSDVNVQSNLVELREIAVEQYGMIDEKYLEMTYLDTEKEETIESYEEERREGIGLSALLSALGIKK